MTVRILLAKDHEEMWDFLPRRLKRRGYEIVVATDGREGVDKARSEQPDVILPDMNLPVTDGWTAAGRIKKGPATAELRSSHSPPMPSATTIMPSPWRPGRVPAPNGSVRHRFKAFLHTCVAASPTRSAPWR